ncbi:MAG: JAB domain-containing protein [Lachnospiraceae bacterium]|nr:JAB domain-containing protein [Lachnospiraceae bacterium]
MGDKKGQSQWENQETIPTDRECQKRCSRLILCPGPYREACCQSGMRAARRAGEDAPSLPDGKKESADRQMPGQPGMFMPLSLLEHGQVSIVRLQMVKESRHLYGMGAVSEPGEAARMVRPLFEGADRELLVVLSMDQRNKPVAAEVVAVGGLNQCVVDIRNLFKHAILANAAGIFLFHSHPSGEAVPSREDRAVTERASQAGEILGIPLVDHIILGDGQYFSFREEKMWAGPGKGVMGCR